MVLSLTVELSHTWGNQRRADKSLLLLSALAHMHSLSDLRIRVSEVNDNAVHEQLMTVLRSAFIHPLLFFPAV
jgi:hypothetical protein